MAHVARESGIAIVAGDPERHGDAVYNPAMLIGPDGTRLRQPGISG